MQEKRGTDRQRQRATARTPLQPLRIRRCVHLFYPARTGRSCVKTRRAYTLIAGPANRSGKFAAENRIPGFALDISRCSM